MDEKLFAERFNGPRRPQWLDFSDNFEGQGITAVQAFTEVGLNYQVVKQPHTFTWGGKTYPYPGKFDIIREPTMADPYPKPLNVVGGDFKPIQNTDIANVIDLLTDTWPVHSVGSIQSGRGIFVALDAGECNINGNTIRQFFTLSDIKGGGTSLKIFFTPIVLWCQNQLTTAWDKAVISAKLAHYDKADETLKLRVKLMAAMKKGQANTLAQFQRMAQIAVDATVRDAAIRAAFPYPPRPRKAELMQEIDSEEVRAFQGLVTQAMTAQYKWEWICSRVDAFRAGAGVLIDRYNDHFPESANTAWAVWMGLTEMSDWREGSSKDLALSTLQGSRAQEKVRAYETLIKSI